MQSLITQTTDSNNIKLQKHYLKIKQKYAKNETNRYIKKILTKRKKK